MRTCVRMIACVLLPLLDLRAALGERRERLREPVAVAPPGGGPSRIGEVSPAARALGVRSGMRLGEAVDICPGLGFVPPDPTRIGTIHERALTRLESVGAETESKRPGEIFFSTVGIERLHGGPEGVLGAARRVLGPDPVLAVAPTRLAAVALARQSCRAVEGGAPRTGPGGTPLLAPDRLRTFLSGLPVTALAGRLDLPPAAERDLFHTLERLGLKRLGNLTALTADQVADRFGPPGSRARELALGREERIRPRRPRVTIDAAVELPEEASGAQLRAALALLCDRMAVRLGAAGQTARALAFEAELAGGGSWNRELVPRRPTASATLFGVLLASTPEQLPRPAVGLRLRVTAAASADPEQLEVTPRPEEVRRARLDEAARQVRAATGETGLMRVLGAEVGSRLPERRVFLTPYLAE